MNRKSQDVGQQGAEWGSRFPRALRLRRRVEFRRVFDRGRSRSDKRLIVYALPREDDGPSRLGLAVGRKFGSSPERNRWKRLVRTAFRTRRTDLPEPCDLVVLPVMGGTGRASLEEISSSLVNTSCGAAKTFRERGPRRPRKS